MEGSDLRKCANIKSRKHREAQCVNTATHGDFCFRHYKNPIRFQSLKKSESLDHIVTRSESRAASCIQKFCKQWIAKSRFRRQGPAANSFSLAQNETEIYSLEDLDTIPLVFFFSFSDEKKSIWAFDIRSLSHMLSQGSEIQNPYTRLPISSLILHKIHERILWLRHRKYPILHDTGENLTQNQLWNQKVLDVFFKMEALGYRASCRWFDDMNIADHETFYRLLFRLWHYQLGLTAIEKEALVPGYNSGMTKLFKQNPERLMVVNHDLRWWRRTNLNLILEFLTRAPNKSQQSLGALYVLMGLVQVVDEAAEAYPWVRESFA